MLKTQTEVGEKIGKVRRVGGGGGRMVKKEVKLNFAEGFFFIFLTLLYNTKTFTFFPGESTVKVVFDLRSCKSLWAVIVSSAESILETDSWTART